MKVILLYVCSVDGKLTKWEQRKVHTWTSPEDAAHFLRVRKKNNLIVMGSNTYNAAQPKPEEGTLRVVLTRNPEEYVKETVPGQLEFSRETPENLIKRLEQQGYKQMILVSGKTLTTEFLKKKLVNELWLTIEPKMFGLGDSMVAEEKLNIQLQLIKLQKLNRKGTLLIQYKVEK